MQEIPIMTILETWKFASRLLNLIQQPLNWCLQFVRVCWKTLYPNKQDVLPDQCRQFKLKNRQASCAGFFLDQSNKKNDFLRYKGRHFRYLFRLQFSLKISFLTYTLSKTRRELHIWYHFNVLLVVSCQEKKNSIGLRFIKLFKWNRAMWHLYFLLINCLKLCCIELTHSYVNVWHDPNTKIAVSAFIFFILS